jgi:hypothetical protein
MNAHPRSANNGCQVQPDLAVRNLVNQSYRAGMCCRPKLARAFARRCAIGAGRPATNLRTRRCRAASFMTIATFLSCRDWGAARWRAFVAHPACEGCRNVCRQPQSSRGACTRLRNGDEEKIHFARGRRSPHRCARAGQCRARRNQEEVTPAKERFSIGKIMQSCR